LVETTASFLENLLFFAVCINRGGVTMNKINIKRRSILRFMGISLIIVRKLFSKDFSEFEVDVSKCKQRDVAKILVYTSDIHFSLPYGRWAFINEKYMNFLEQTWANNKIYFFNGDLIDNVPKNKDLRIDNYREREWDFFLKKTRKILKRNTILYNYGSGHDFGSISKVENFFKQKHIGKYQWGRESYFDMVYC
jgi:hypothetical protein